MFKVVKNGQSTTSPASTLVTAFKTSGGGGILATTGDHITRHLLEIVPKAAKGQLQEGAEVEVGCFGFACHARTGDVLFFVGPGVVAELVDVGLEQGGDLLDI